MHVTTLLLLSSVVVSWRSRDKMQMRPSPQHAHRRGESGGVKRIVTRLVRSNSHSMDMLLLLLLLQLRTRLAPVYKTPPAKQQLATADLCALNRG